MSENSLRVFLVLITSFVWISIANIFLPHLPGVSSVQSYVGVDTLSELTNQDRSKASQLPLKEDAELDREVSQRASKLCSAPFSHESWEDSFNNLPYTHIGENIARNYPDAESVNDAFMASPEHRQNILDPQFSDIGIDKVICGKNNPYGTSSVVVELFGGYIN